MSLLWIILIVVLVLALLGVFRPRPLLVGLDRSGLGRPALAGRPFSATLGR